MENFISAISGSSWAILKETAEVLASSGLQSPAVKPNGELNQVNSVTKRDDGIYIIPIDGALTYRTGVFSAMFGRDTYNSIEAALDECKADPMCRGVILDVNSPGGEVSGCADLAQKIYDSRESFPCGIVARTGGVMCSAAYWLGSSAEKVYTAENGKLGSIGTMVMFSKKGDSATEMIVSDLSPKKNLVGTEGEGLANIKAELNDLTGVFISAVARNRGTTYEDVLNNYGQGGVFIGSKAVEAGLADGIKSIDEIAEEMLNKQRNGVTMTNKKTEAVAEQAAETVDVAAIQQSAIAEERARVKAIGDVFAGLAVDSAKVQALIDEGKSVADAKELAFAEMKAMLSAKDAEIAELKAAKPAQNAEQAAAVKAMLDKENKASASVESGVNAEETPVLDKAIAVAFALGSK